MATAAESAIAAFGELEAKLAESTTIAARYGDAIKQIGVSMLAGAGAIAAIVASADPGNLFVFQRALRDTTATIGQLLVPILQTLTEIIKTFGGAVASLGPEAQRMIQALVLGGIAMAAFTAAIAVFEAVATGGIAPIIGLLLGVAAGGTILSGGLAKLQEAMSRVGEFISRVFELVAPAFDKLVAALSPVFETIGGAAAQLAGALAQGLIPVIDVIVKLIASWMDVIKPLIPVVVSVVSVIVQLASSIAQAWFGIMVPIFNGIARAFQVLAPFIAEASKHFQELGRVAAGVVTMIGETITRIIALIIETGFFEFGLRVLGNAMVIAVTTTERFAKALVVMTNVMIELINRLSLGLINIPKIRLPEIGLEVPERERKQATPGIREVGTGSIEDITKNLLVDALRSSIGDKTNEEKQLAAMQQVEANTGQMAMHFAHFETHGNQAVTQGQSDSLDVKIGPAKFADIGFKAAGIIPRILGLR